MHQRGTNLNMRPIANSNRAHPITHGAASRYVIISPVRDEEQFIVRTIESVIAQTIRPVEWIIVDDGSHDATASIIDEAAKQYPWITAVHHADRGQRVPGTGVMEAFYEGFRRLKSPDWEFVVKLDGDVGLEPDYFQQCLDRLYQNPQLGICGGRMYTIRNRILHEESHPDFHVRGPIKLYRRKCFEAIGGLIVAPGWDTVDEVQANRLGWLTKTFTDLRVVHHRPTGAVQGAWQDGVKLGKCAYVSCYHPAFMMMKCVKRIFQKPYVIGAIAHAYGFISSYLKRLNRVEDPEYIRYIRNQQIRRLLFRKSIWK
jgi:poly-beta-1,6-N-acetyl-D-glucosamine synthase